MFHIFLLEYGMNNKKLILYTNDKTGRNVWLTEKYVYDSGNDFERSEMMTATHFVVRENDKETNDNLYHGVRLFLDMHGEPLSAD